MNEFRRKLLMLGLKSFDLLVTTFAFMAVALAVSSELEYIDFAQFLSLRIKVQNFLLFFGFLSVCSLIFRNIGLYHSKRFSKQYSETVDILKAVSFCTLAILVTGTVFEIEIVTLVFGVVFWFVDATLLVLSRLIFRRILSRIRLRGHNLRQVLVVGTNPRTVQFAKKVESQPELGYHLIGFVDNIWPGIHRFHQIGYPLVCDLNNLAQFLRDNVVDEVIMGLPLKSFYQKASETIDLCEKQGIIVRFLPDIFDLKMARSKAEEFEGEMLITVYTGHMEGWPVLVKRILDFCFALCLLILASPVFLITALLIKLTSPGPILFIQERVGFNKRTFWLYKFRTMVADAEERLAELEHLNEVGGPVFKIRNDPRITKIGKFLRKTSIDELPQLINVLKSDMSLVGPRPLPIRDYKGFGHDWHRRRFSVRPGITCLWQVNGRTEIPFEKWMELDMQYIDHWSLWLDLKILIKTMPVVLKGSGAA